MEGVIFDYEFDAPTWYDFNEINSPEDQFADRWFDQRLRQLQKAHARPGINWPKVSSPGLSPMRVKTKKARVSRPIRVVGPTRVQSYCKSQTSGGVSTVPLGDEDEPKKARKRSNTVEPVQRVEARVDQKEESDIEIEIEIIEDSGENTAEVLDDEKDFVIPPPRAKIRRARTSVTKTARPAKPVPYTRANRVASIAVRAHIPKPSPTKKTIIKNLPAAVNPQRKPLTAASRLYTAQNKITTKPKNRQPVKPPNPSNVPNYALPTAASLSRPHDTHVHVTKVAAELVCGEKENHVANVHIVKKKPKCTTPVTPEFVRRERRKKMAQCSPVLLATKQPSARAGPINTNTRPRWR